MCGDDYGMKSLGKNVNDFHKRTVYQPRIWKRQYYGFPIYVDEYEKNPHLVEAPFWLD